MYTGKKSKQQIQSIMIKQRHVFICQLLY